MAIAIGPTIVSTPKSLLKKVDKPLRGVPAVGSPQHKQPPATPTPLHMFVVNG